MLTRSVKFKQTALGPIPEEWERFELGEFTEIIKNSYKPITSEKLQYIGLEHIDQQSLSLNSIGISSAVKSNKLKFQNGDILFGKLRPYFRKVYRPKFSGVCSTDIWVLRAKKGFDQGWLFYLVAGQDFIKSASSGSSGTRMPRADWQYLSKTVWPVPPLPEQTRIASILSSFDSKIELNRQMNKTLEEIASTIFKRWFVDFEFPNEHGEPYKSSGGKMVESELGMMPEGWRVTELGKFFPIKTGKKDANVAVDNGQYPFFSCSQDVLHTDIYSFDSASILLAGNGDFNVKWYEGKFEAYQRTYVLTPYNKLYLGFLFYTLKYFLDNLTSGHRGSVIHFITKGMIENFKISVPPDSNLAKMAGIFYEINKSIEFNKKQIDILASMRNSLLPRLMSGRIRVDA